MLVENDTTSGGAPIASPAPPSSSSQFSHSHHPRVLFSSLPPELKSTIGQHVHEADKAARTLALRRYGCLDVADEGDPVELRNKTANELVSLVIRCRTGIAELSLINRDYYLIASPFLWESVIVRNTPVDVLFFLVTTVLPSQGQLVRSLTLDLPTTVSAVHLKELGETFVVAVEKLAQVEPLPASVDVLRSSTHLEDRQRTTSRCHAHAEKPLESKDRGKRHRVLFQCGCGRYTPPHISRLSDWDYIGCLAHAWVCYREDSTVLEIPGYSEHNQACQSERRARGSLPLHEEVIEWAVGLMQTGIEMSSILKQNILKCSSSSYSAMAGLYEKTANHEFLIEPKHYRSLHRRYWNAFLIDVRNSVERNLQDWSTALWFIESTFGYIPRTEDNDRFRPGICTPVMRDAAWKYGHIIMDEQARSTGQQLLFSAKEGHSFTGGSYDTKVLTEMLVGWKEFLGKTANGESFSPKLATTDTNVKERTALSSVFPGIRLRICRFHLRQAWKTERCQCFGGTGRREEVGAFEPGQPSCQRVCRILPQIAAKRVAEAAALRRRRARLGTTKLDLATARPTDDEPSPAIAWRNPKTPLSAVVVERVNLLLCQRRFDLLPASSSSFVFSGMSSVSSALVGGERYIFVKRRSGFCSHVLLIEELVHRGTMYQNYRLPPCKILSSIDIARQVKACRTSRLAQPSYSFKPLHLTAASQEDTPTSDLFTTRAQVDTDDALSCYTSSSDEDDASLGGSATDYDEEAQQDRIRTNAEAVQDQLLSRLLTNLAMSQQFFDCAAETLADAPVVSPALLSAV
ncbi:hypothetical protein JCM8547_002843 [Rhodosporidiobolus lusitaniae]